MRRRSRFIIFLQPISPRQSRQSLITPGGLVQPTLDLPALQVNSWYCVRQLVMCSTLITRIFVFSLLKCSVMKYMIFCLNNSPTSRSTAESMRSGGLITITHDIFRLTKKISMSTRLLMHMQQNKRTERTPGIAIMLQSGKIVKIPTGNVDNGNGTVRH